MLPVEVSLRKSVAVADEISRRESGVVVPIPKLLPLKDACIAPFEISLRLLSDALIPTLPSLAVPLALR